MQITGSTDVPHLIYDVVCGLAVFGASWVGMLIKNQLAEIKNHQLENQLKNERKASEVKEELMGYNGTLSDTIRTTQMEMKEELVKQVAVVASDLRDHTTEDKGIFRELQKTLERIERLIIR